MKLSDIIQKCELIQKRLIPALPGIIRPYCETIKTESRGIIFYGARGVGKTTYMLQKIKDKHILFIPVDNPAVGSVPLYDLAEAAFLKGYEGICVDEVHYAKDWSVHLKGIYDSFPDKTIRASDSGSIILKKGIADLSRRFVYIKLPLLSLREFLAIQSGEYNEPFDPFVDNFADIATIMKNHNILRLFEEYSCHGFRPIFNEGIKDYPDKVMNTVFKSLDEDIPFLVPGLSANHIRLMRAVLGYLGTSSIPRLNISSLCSDWGLSKDKLYQLLEAMELAHVIRIVRHKKNHSVHTAGAKIFYYEPSLYKTYMEHTGNFREAFTVCAFREAGRQVWACKNEQEGDFVIGDMVVEVGGSKKKAKGADFVVRDDIDFPIDNALPLWILGFVW